jgi:hypothetical protein
MAWSDETAEMAADCASQLGRSVTIEVDTAGSLNTTTGRRTPASTTQYTLAAIRSRTTASPAAGQGKSSDLRIVYTIAQAAWTAAGITPAQAARVIDAGETWSITGTAARGEISAVDLYCARKARA